MKKLILTLLIAISIAFTSCDDGWSLRRKTIHQVKGVVLRAEKVDGGEAMDTYRIYLYDGRSADWMDTDADTYNALKNSDTIQVTLVEETYTKKEQ